MVRRKAGQLVPLEVEILHVASILAIRGRPRFYGYELAEELARHEGSTKPRPYATLYRALARLERGRLLASIWQLPESDAVGGAQPRHMYWLTSDGETQLAAALEASAMASVSGFPRGSLPTPVRITKR